MTKKIAGNSVKSGCIEAFHIKRGVYYGNEFIDKQTD